VNAHLGLEDESVSHESINDGNVANEGNKARAVELERDCGRVGATEIEEAIHYNQTVLLPGVSAELSFDNRLDADGSQGQGKTYQGVVEHNNSPVDCLEDSVDDIVEREEPSENEGEGHTKDGLGGHYFTGTLFVNDDGVLRDVSLVSVRLAEGDVDDGGETHSHSEVFVLKDWFLVDPVSND